ncbi:MFS transporter [Pseudarthrobacter phenanthrenivorans]|uniref:MFS transporter n=2 Tax=Pseudarthrobacter phenanthrenivorans TaxID=361575 RepID=A0A3B0FUY9_PSEPS|nr:MFS transporter [Pseudarthrobacter phenanthrenivorans]ADX74019.1 Major Facilitator Superfamily transporter [Pseudarthrobacter phenanthrenivorans Sphe3]RKO25451.1 MFS transporter [Pseudarthrobacter phenanthrenivorans]TPV51873.1 MFS transporter [Pseudarthrobacter phenanthrenivorans]
MGKLLADITPLKESPAFRRLWLGSAVSAVGSQLTLVAVSLEIYRLTQDSFYVGLLAVFALVPLVVGGLLGGSIADSHDRRRVALLATAVLWLTTGLIALQAWLQLGNVWVLYLLVAVQSGAQAINQPARSAILPMLVRKELLPAANALSMMSFGLAMTVGPLLAGVLVAWVGFGWTYTLDFASFAFVLWAVYRLPPLPPSGSPGRPGVRSVVEGFRFLGTRPNLRMTFIIDLIAMILAQPRALMPAIGAVMIGGGEATVGILLASTAIGAFLAGLFSGPLGIVRRQGSAVVFSVMGWGASIAGFGLVVLLAGRAPDGAVTFWLLPAAACCALAGIADSISSVFRNTILQAATPDHLRGRLQGVFIVVVAGGPRIGDLLAGAGTRILAEGWVLLLGGLLCIAGAWVAARLQPGFRRYDARNPVP